MKWVVDERLGDMALVEEDVQRSGALVEFFDDWGPVFIGFRGR